MRKLVFWSGMLLCICIVIAQPVMSQEGKSNAVHQEIFDYDLHRQEYKNALTEEQARFEQRKNEIESEFNKLSGEGGSLERQISVTNSSIRSRESTNRIIQGQFKTVTRFLYPEIAIPTLLLGLASEYKRFVWTILVLLCLWLFVLHFVMLDRIKKTRLHSYKTLIYCLFGLSLALVSVSAFAQDNPRLSQDEKLKNEFELTNKILSLSEHERYIRILESTDEQTVLLPKLESGSDRLKVYQKVSSHTAEYFVTLAALNSYLGNNGEAVAHMKKLIDVKAFNKSNRDSVLVNAVKYLIDLKQTEAASDLFQSKLTTIENTSQLLSLADFMERNGFESSAAKALEQAIDHAKTTSSLIELSEFLYSKNRNKAGLQAAQKSFTRATSPQDLILASKVLAKRDGLPNVQTMYSSLNKVYRNRQSDSKKSFNSYSTDMINAISTGTNQERPREMFKEVLSNVRKSDQASYKHLLDFALDKNWLEQAQKVTEKFAKSLARDERFTYTVRPSRRLDVEEGIPSPEELTLPVLAGLINENMGLDDNAKNSYSHSITNSLKRLQESFGITDDNDLNGFYLLGRLLKKEQNVELLEELDKTYTLVEQAELKQLAIKNDLILSDMESSNAKQLEKNSNLIVQLKSLKQQDAKGATKTVKLMTGLIGIITFALVLITASIIHAADYASKLSEQKYFGFTFKLLETIGWTKVCSVLGAISGIFFVLLGQFGIIFKRTHEETKQINLARSKDENTKESRIEEIETDSNLQPAS